MVNVLMRRSWLLICAFAVSLPTMGAGVYKWVDEQGNVHYTQTPPADKPVERFETRPEPVDSEAALKKLEEQKEKSDSFFKDRAKQAEEKAKAEEEATKRGEHCKRARENLEKLETTIRLFQSDEQGNRVRMTEEERQAGIAKAKSQIKEFCKA